MAQANKGMKLSKPEYLVGGWPIRPVVLESGFAAYAQCSADTKSQRRCRMCLRAGLRMPLFLAACGLSAAIAWGEHAAREGCTGFYLVAAMAPSADALPPPTREQRIVRDSSKYLRDSEATPVLYVLLSRRPDVVLTLANAPVLQQRGPNGFSELQLELTKEAAADLERMTRKHLGQRVALVVDGDVVTIHKIRSVISDGKVQLTRCTDNACQYLYTRLTKKR
jgi:hypothetical protein